MCKQKSNNKKLLTEVPIYFYTMPKTYIQSTEEINERFKMLRQKRRVFNNEIFLLPFLDLVL